MTREQEELELDLGRLLWLAAGNLGKILICTVLSAALALGGTVLFDQTRYQSTTVFYVSDAQQVENLEDAFAVVLKTRQTLMEVIRVTGVEMNHVQLGKMIRTASLQDTHFFQVIVTGPDPYEARTLAEAIGEVLPQRIEEIMSGTKAVVADAAILETEPCGPNYGMNTLLGALSGLALALMGILLQAIFPKKKRSA